MPEKILELLEKCSLTEEQIARELNVTLDELRAGMDYLKQMGFIKSTSINPTSSCSGGCGGNCSKCGGTCYNSTGSAYTLWEII